MPLDPSIYSQYLRPPKSVADYDREAYDTDRARAGSQYAQLELLAGQQKLGEQQRQAGAYEQVQQLIRSGGSEEGAIRALQAAGKYDVAGTMEKGMLDRQQSRADIKAKEATTAKTFGEAQDGALKRYRGILDFVDTPATADRWMRAQYADPELAQYMLALGPLDQALQRIPQDPAGFQQWRQQATMGMDRHMEQQRLQAGQTETARNNRASDATTRRGQDLADARAREAAGAPQFVPVEGVGLFVGDKKTGQARPVTGPDGLPIKPVKPAPQYVVEGVQKGAKALDTIERAIELVSTPEGKSALGLKNMAPGTVGRAAVNFADPKGVEARAALADISSLEIKDRSGATVTVGEEPRLMPFIPLATDNPEVAKTKLQRLRQAISQDYQMLGEFYPDALQTAERARSKGGRLTNVPLTGGAPASPGSTAVDALLKKYGQ